MRHSTFLSWSHFMANFIRQAAATSIAVMIASAFPLAQTATPAPPARQTPPAATTPAAPQAGPKTIPERRVEVFAAGADAEQTRERLRQLLERHPPSLADVLRLDPTLLTNTDYLAPYPELAAFLTEHPEVAHNPAFYIGTPQGSPWERDPRAGVMRMWEEVMQGLMILCVIGVITGVLVWLVRTLVDYRRWLRLTRIQTETHTKLMDRLTSHEDLLAYMQTPAGRRFLESAPIALDAASRPLGAPLSRVLWSVQAGAVLGLGGVGMLFVSRRAMPEVGEGLWTIGVLALALGAGFLVSAVVAYLLASRLGLFDTRASLPSEIAATTPLPTARD
jgi:hypothetical protein